MIILGRSEPLVVVEPEEADQPPGEEVGKEEGGGRGGSGGGRGGRIMVNGVDVTNPKQTFSKEEWEKLKGQWQYIWDRRASRATQDAHG